MNRLLRRAATAALALAVAAGCAISPAHASIPERTDAVPAPAIDPGFPIVTGGAGFYLPPQFVDLDLDGKTDIVAVDNLGRIYAVGSGGIALGGWPRFLGEPLSGAPAVGDLDQDGVLDLVAVTQSGKVRAFRSNGTNLFPPKQLPGTPIGAPVLAELDGSGRQAVIVATSDGKLHAVDSSGQFVAGWPVTGPGPAIGGAFTFIAGDNFPRVGYLASPGGAAIFFTYAAIDNPYSYDPLVPLGPAMPVSGAHLEPSPLSDIDQLYLAARGGQLYRFDTDVISQGGDPVALSPILGDSIVDTPGLVDLTGDLIPELALRSLRGDTLSITVVDGLVGTPLVGFPRRYINSSPGGAIVAADLGDGATPELVFNQGGDRVTCISSNGTLQWTLTGLPAVAGPAIGDLQGDGALDLAVVTTDGRIVAYTLGNAGIGPRGVEWPNSDGLADHARRHHVRDRAALRAQWPAPLTPPSAFTKRAAFGDLNGDGLPEAVWSDYATGRTFAWNQAAGVAPGWPQDYVLGANTDAPAIGDVTGDGIFETVQSTSNGLLVWGDKTGVTASLLVDSGKILTPPALADINGDGTLDAVVGSNSGRLYAVNLITRTVIPGFPVTTAGAILLPPALGDVNGDGQTDIVVVASQRYIYAYGRTGVAPLAGWPRLFPSGSSLTQPILVPVAGNTGLAVAFGQARADSVVVNLVGANSMNRPGWPRVLVGTVIYGPVAGDFNNDGAPDFAYSTGNLIASNPGADSIYVFVANGNRALTKYYPSPGNVEVAGIVDVDLDQRPDVIAVSDLSTVVAVRFNGLISRAFDRLLFFFETGQPPSFGDMGNDGTMEMALSDLGLPILYTFGFGSWNPAYAPWPMKGHDSKRTNAFSGLTVVGVGDPGPGPGVVAGWARALPNPASGRVALSHSRPLVGRFEAAIFDLRGRLVRRIAAGEARPSDGAPTWTWDGADESGRSAAAGVYFYRVVDTRGAMATRVVRLR